MSTKLTYTGAEVQELLDKIEKGDFDNAKTLEGHPASYFAIASEFTSLAESFATEQGRINTLYSYFNNGSANDALRLGGQLPSYYATATQYEILQQALTDFKSLFDSMFEKDSENNIHAKLSLWSSGGITAGGVGSGSSGGGGISYNRLDSWADYSADKAGYVLSALLGKDLDSRVSALANAGYVTASALAPYALRSELPIITKDRLKSTLGISDWALASAKPTYTASEVGALGVNDTAINANKLGGYLPTTYMRASGQYTDSLNDLTSLGIYRMSGTIKDGPTGAGGYGNLMVVRSNSWDSLSQLYFNAINNRIFVRSGTNSNFTSKDWSTLAYISDIPSLAGYATQSWVGENYLSKNGGTVNGETVLQHSNSLILTIKRTGSGASLIRYNGDEGLRGGIGFGTDGVARIWDNTLSGNYPILTSDNFSQYALPLTGGVMAKNSYINWGNTDGFEDYSAYSNGFKILGYNAGSGDYRGGIHVGVRYGWQLTRNAGSEVFQIRNYSPSSASWGDWKTIAYISDIPTKLSDLTDDVVVGKYLPLSGGTVNGDLKVSGVATLGSLVRLIETDGSTLYKVIQRNSGGNILLGSDYTRDLYIDFDKVRVRSNGTIFSREVTAPTFIGNLTGNADSATKLATPRTIWGQSFDGTGDITGDIMFAGPNKIAWHNDKNYYYISSPTTSTSAYLEYNAYGGHSFLGGNVTIGGGPAYERLYVYGNGKFTGALTVNSLTIGGVTLTYDSGNEALCINGNMYALGGVTAGGAGISAYTSLEARVARIEQQLNIS